MLCLPLPPVSPECFLGIRPQTEYRKHSKGWRNTFQEMGREHRHHLSKGLSNQKLEPSPPSDRSDEASSGGCSETLLYLPGRYHESCQESLRHAQGKPERVLAHNYEIDEWQNHSGVDGKPAERGGSLRTTSPDLSPVLNHLLKRRHL